MHQLRNTEAKAPLQKKSINPLLAEFLGAQN